MTNGTEHKVVGLAEELRCIACFDRLSPADRKAIESAADRIDELEDALRQTTQETKSTEQRMADQRNEFLALDKLAVAFNALPAVVDDDYPMCRSRYEGELQNFIEMLRANGRI